MVSERTRTYFVTHGRHKFLAPVAWLPVCFRLFSGAMSYTGFRTGYNSRVPGSESWFKSEITNGIYNLCSPWM